MKVQELITEITRLHSFANEDRFFQGLYNERTVPKRMKPLPGGSGLMYAVERGSDGMDITIWDKSNTKFAEYGWLAGRLEIEHYKGFPVEKTYFVNLIEVSKSYQGKSIAKSLYGIALDILGLNLASGSSQSPGGRRNWVSLSKIPGVEVIGYVMLAKDFKGEIYTGDIDILMQKLGAINLGTYRQYYIFGFEVQPNETGKELEAKFKTRLSRVYAPYHASVDTGLIARRIG